MFKLYRAVRASLSVAILLSLSSCAASTQIGLSSAELPSQPHILDLQLARVTMTGCTMRTALRNLEEEIKAQSSGLLQFDYVTSINIPRQMDYARRGIPVTQWKMNDPQISIRLQDVTFRILLDEMCQQSGWSYTTGAPGLRPPGIAFVDDKSWFLRGRR